MKQTDSPEDWARPKPETLTEPTWWPAALAFGATLFIWGLVASYVIAAIGFIVTVTSLSGWIEIFAMNTTNPNDSPHPPSGASPEELSRRRFFSRLSVILGSFCGAVLAIPALGFILAPLMSKPPQLWRAVGKANDFQIGKTVKVTIDDSSPLPWAGVTARSAAWLRRVNKSEFTAFAINCSHLGCPVRWLQDANLFMCPCHGGVYYADGRVAAGPPPYALTRYNVRVQGGEVQIQTRAIPIH